MISRPFSHGLDCKTFESDRRVGAVRIGTSAGSDLVSGWQQRDDSALRVAPDTVAPADRTIAMNCTDSSRWNERAP
ncbi:hypothetical protein GCM10020219_066540 [Nonomuraea dietziae]